jgi:pyruvate dehydrogenase E1 component alpha subunit
VTGTQLSDEDLGRLLLIRHFELALLDLYATRHVSGTVHTCLGQEYVPVALAPFIAGDHVFSNHRGHGHYLALHDDPAGLLAEILGRDGAVCHGVGGSQHVYLEDRFLSTGVQGESLPVAVGVALHMRRTAPGRMAVAFVGDGTFGEGAVYEALNIAQLWQVPLLVVVEHNGIAQSTPTEWQMAGTVKDRVAAFGIAHHRLTTNDIGAIRSRVAAPLARARHEPAPLVLEFDTVRLGPHSKGDDTRPADEVRALWERDWAAPYAERFPDQFTRVDAAQRERVRCLVEDVQARPLSRWEAAAR